MLRSLWVLFVFLVATAIAGLTVTVVSLLRPGSHIGMRGGKAWSRVILRAMAVRVEYEGVETGTSRLPCIFISNHLSNADIWALLCALPESTRFVAKQSLFYVPFLGWALTSAGFVPIDRKNRTRAIASLELAAKKIRDGVSIILFPEGTRSRDGRLQAFKKGPFHLAAQAGVPIVPISIHGSFSILRPGSIYVRPGRILVRFLPAIDPATLPRADHAALLQLVHDAIRRDQELESATDPVAGPVSTPEVV